MKNILFDFTPGITPSQQAALDAAQKQIAKSDAERQAAQERYAAAVAETGGKAYVWEKTS
jgi:hypothetical protein